ncbi:hypothetical protein SOW02_07000 [Pectobacterium actinidiae]|nr:hypothetical protein [Pectobacterium actinidiae]
MELFTLFVSMYGLFFHMRCMVSYYLEIDGNGGVYATQVGRVITMPMVLSPQFFGGRVLFFSFNGEG